MAATNILDIDHPIRELLRRLESGEADRDAGHERVMRWALEEPKTPATARALLFDLLGPDFSGCVALAVEAVMDPETAEDSLGVPEWTAVGMIDEAAVLELDDGTWFGVGDRPADADDREMGVVRVPADLAAILEAEMEAGLTGRIVTVPDADVVRLGRESAFRASMAQAPA